MGYKHTLLVVSHDRGFLNEVCTDIMEFKRKKITYYRGNFDTYVRLRDEDIRNAMRQYQAYESKREHMMEFINKFRAKAGRASMVQSRVKAVEKMDLDAPEPVEVDRVWRFSIPNSEPLSRPIIAINDVSFDYNPKLADGSKKDESGFLLRKVNFGVDLTSRIAILGANGQGKTTLLNLIMGKITPLKGGVVINGGLRIGHFTQHSSDNFDLKRSAIENMLDKFEDAEDQEIRKFLGKFQIQGDDALKPMQLLSGGQKSRVAFATLAYTKPHVMIIDEGSNHLSMEAVDALIEALQDFQGESFHSVGGGLAGRSSDPGVFVCHVNTASGLNALTTFLLLPFLTPSLLCLLYPGKLGGIMVVSHDQYFVSRVCSELWVVHDGAATRFKGDFDEYKNHTAEITQKRVDESVKRVNAINSNS